MTTTNYPVEVCFTAALFDYYKDDDATVIIVDILRATSSICTAFMHGANKIIPVSSDDMAREYKRRGYMVAAEQDGTKLDFADFGNSPQNFSGHLVKDKEIVYSTTNGTKIIQKAVGAKQILIGSFLNLQAMAQRLCEHPSKVLIFCAGWKNKFNLEDALYAGALTQLLLENPLFSCDCDSAKAAVDLWEKAAGDLHSYTRKIAWIKRIKQPDVLDYCFTPNVTSIIPVYDKGAIIAYK